MNSLIQILKDSEPAQEMSAGQQALWKKVRGIAAINNFSNFVGGSVHEEEEFPKIDTDVFYPNSMCPNEVR